MDDEEEMLYREMNEDDEFYMGDTIEDENDAPMRPRKSPKRNQRRAKPVQDSHSLHSPLQHSKSQSSDSQSLEDKEAKVIFYVKIILTCIAIAILLAIGYSLYKHGGSYDNAFEDDRGTVRIVDESL